MKFNDLLNKYITEIGCTAKELSEVSGLSAAALSRYRTGERVPGKEQLAMLIGGLVSLAEKNARSERKEQADVSEAGREIRVMVVPEHVNDADMVLLAHDIAKQIESELEYPGQIKVNVIRESRAIDYAK